MTCLSTTRWKAFLVVAVVSWASAADAQETDLQRCLRIADVAERVACYDDIARAQQAPRDDAVADSAPAPVSVSAPPNSPLPETAVPPASDVRKEFGRSAIEREEARQHQPRQLDEVTVVIASSRIVGAGYWQFTTTEGSTWRLAETSRNFRPPRAGDSVLIRRGRLGSYYLEADKQPSMRINRVD